MNVLNCSYFKLPHISWFGCECKSNFKKTLPLADRRHCLFVVLCPVFLEISSVQVLVSKLLSLVFGIFRAVVRILGVLSACACVHHVSVLLHSSWCAFVRRHVFLHSGVLSCWMVSCHPPHPLCPDWSLSLSSCFLTLFSSLFYVLRFCFSLCVFNSKWCVYVIVLFSYFILVP